MEAERGERGILTFEVDIEYSTLVDESRNCEKLLESSNVEEKPLPIVEIEAKLCCLLTPKDEVSKKEFSSMYKELSFWYLETNVEGL